MNTITRRGLTLLELGIVLAVLAVLGALAVPHFGARLEHHRLQTTAQLLAGDISEARFEAARRHQALRVSGQAGAEWCWTVAASPGCGCGRAEACQIHSEHADGHHGITLAAIETMRLEPEGAATAAAAATLESAHGERIRVEVSALGRPRICALQGSWPQVPPC
jgi:type IV fimbrial biogenesis protein FimT